MASANQTLSPHGGEFEVDGTQRTATLLRSGGRVRNTGAVACVINVDGGTVTVTQPCGDSCHYIAAGANYLLPDDCAAFTFKSVAAATYLDYSGFTIGNA